MIFIGISLTTIIATPFVGSLSDKYLFIRHWIMVAGMIGTGIYFTLKKKLFKFFFFSAIFMPMNALDVSVFAIISIFLVEGVFFSMKKKNCKIFGFFNQINFFFLQKV